MSTTLQRRGFSNHDGDADPIVYVFDAFYLKADLVTPQVIAENAGGWVKISEGQAPESRKDKILSERIFAGAIDIAERIARAGKPYGFYHYPTIGRDGSRHFWDVEDEVSHCVAQVRRADAHLRSLGLPGQGLRFMFDPEDYKRDMSAEARTSWCHWFISRVEAELEHTPIVYLSERYVRKYLLDVDGLFGAPLKRHGLEMYDLIQPHYGNNDPDRDLSEEPQLPIGFRERAAWQFTSEFAGGLDRSIVDLDAVMINA